MRAIRGLFISFSRFRARGSHLLIALALLPSSSSTAGSAAPSSPERSALLQAAQTTDWVPKLIEERVTPPAPVCSPAATEVRPLPPLVASARKILAVQYQNCDVLTLEPISPLHHTLGVLEVPRRDDPEFLTRSISNLDDYMATHPWLSPPNSPKAPAPGCPDLRKAPPLYLYGAKPEISQSPTGKSSADLFVNQAESPNCRMPLGTGNNGVACNSNPVVGMDCSGYLSLAMMNAGMRFSPNKKPGFMSTWQMAQLGQAGKESCMEESPLTPMESALQPGDIFVVPGSHMVLIDSVGPDPFGLSHFQTQEECSAMTPADWDFRILHSSSKATAVGPSRMEGSEYFLNAPEVVGPMLARALEICRRSKPSILKSSSLKSIETTQGSPLNQFGGSILRHAPPARTECWMPVGEKTTLGKAEECLGTCDLRQEGAR